MKNPILLLLTLAFFSLNHLQAQWDSITNFNHVIFDMKTFDNKLFIGGGFLEQDGQTCYWSASYDGSSFTRHTKMIGGTGIDQLEVFNGSLYSVGGLTFSGTIGVAEWNGSTWVNGGSTNYSHSVIYADGNDLYVVSDDGKIRKQTGTGSFQPFYNFSGNDDVNALINYNGGLIVAGKFDTVGGVIAKNIAKWNGSTWEPLGAGLSGGIKCMAVYNGELYVAGNLTHAGGNPVNNITKWNGSSWSDVGGGIQGFLYNGIRDMIVFNNTLIVVGDFDEINGVTTGNVASWNGSQWKGLGLTHDDSFVECAEVYNGQLYVGTFDFERSHLFKYTGTVGIEDNNILHSKIYPNPFTDQFTVEVSDHNTLQIFVYDFLGRQILQKSFSQNTTIDLEQFSDGIYFYSIFNDKGKLGSGEIIKHSRN